ncbi:MAG: hypothetical protein IKS36_01585, partial [Bacteroidales bacterium]|nr:hypothetical protein [Bacteroidales bacterium]
GIMATMPTWLWPTTSLIKSICFKLGLEFEVVSGFGFLCYLRRVIVPFSSCQFWGSMTER